MDEVKIPKGLRELYADCLADDSRAMRTTTSKFMAELIERIVRAEAQVAEADFNFGGWRAIKKRLEAQVAALTEQLRVQRQPVSDEEWPKTWDGHPRPSITRSVFNKMVAARSAAPGKVREDGN